jgi:6-phosphogluconolactonase (cycloisomerase 2 family)
VLTEIAPAVAVGSGPSALAVDRSGRFLYSVQDDDDTLAVFVIDQVDGTLLQIASLAVPDGLLRPEDVGTDPTGQFLYVAAAGDGTLGTSGVSVFAIDPRTGVAVRSTDPSILRGASHVAFHPAGNGLFTILAETSEIASFGIDPLDGGLDENLPRATSLVLPSALTVDLAGLQLFAAFADPLGTGQVSSYAIQPDLSLGAAQGPYFGGTRPSDLAFDPSGNFLNVINRDSNEITTFAYDAGTGLLSAPSSTLTGLGPIAIAVTATLQ